MTGLKEDPEVRFWMKVKSGPGCWEWDGSCNHRGYGKHSISGKTIAAHRYSCELHYGNIPEGLLVCHKCDNPKCVNPKHLFLGTHSDNMLDREKKGRSARVAGSQHGQAKLSEDAVQAIRILYKRFWKKDRVAKGFADFLARWFGVRTETITFAAQGKSWNHI